MYILSVLHFSTLRICFHIELIASFVNAFVTILPFMTKGLIHVQRNSSIYRSSFVSTSRSPYPKTMKTRNRINLRKRLVIYVVLLLTFSAIHALPSIANMRFQSPVSQHGFPEVCEIFQKKIIACWFLQHPNLKVDNVVSESKTRRKRRSSVADRDADKEHEETNARFNFHIYLDHMWHLNIGTTR